MNKCTVVFLRGRDGEIEMYHLAERTISQDGFDLETSVWSFENRLIRTLICLSGNERLVLNIEVQSVPPKNTDINPNKKFDL